MNACKCGYLPIDWDDLREHVALNRGWHHDDRTTMVVCTSANGETVEMQCTVCYMAHVLDLGATSLGDLENAFSAHRLGINGDWYPLDMGADE